MNNVFSKSHRMAMDLYKQCGVVIWWIRNTIAGVRLELINATAIQ